MRIASVGTAYPPHRYSQAAISEALTARWQDRMEEPRLINRLFANCGVEFRNLVFPLEVYENLSGFGPTNDAWIVAAVELGQKALCGALDRVNLSFAALEMNKDLGFDKDEVLIIHIPDFDFSRTKEELYAFARSRPDVIAWSAMNGGPTGSHNINGIMISGKQEHYQMMQVDYDYFEPNNSVRHELGVECFGLNKESALLHRLCSLNPAVAENSSSINFQVGATHLFALEQNFYNLIKASNLIIDTTAIHSVSHFLNRLSCEFEIPTLFASVTNGAWSGEIVRIIPRKTACWLCWLEQYFESKPPSAPVSSAEVFAPGCDQPTFTGTTYDLGIVASLATSMSVETLLQDGEHVDLSKNYIRWSGKDSSGKSLYLTEMLSTNAKLGCPYCGS